MLGTIWLFLCLLSLTPAAIDLGVWTVLKLVTLVAWHATDGAVRCNFGGCRLEHGLVQDAVSFCFRISPPKPRYRGLALYIQESFIRIDARRLQHQPGERTMYDIPGVYTVQLVVRFLQALLAMLGGAVAVFQVVEIVIHRSIEVGGGHKDMKFTVAEVRVRSDAILAPVEQAPRQLSARSRSMGGLRATLSVKKAYMAIRNSTLRSRLSFFSTGASTADPAWAFVTTADAKLQAVVTWPAQQAVSMHSQDLPLPDCVSMSLHLDQLQGALQLPAAGSPQCGSRAVGPPVEGSEPARGQAPHDEAETAWRHRMCCAARGIHATLQVRRLDGAPGQSRPSTGATNSPFAALGGKDQRSSNPTLTEERGIYEATEQLDRRGGHVAWMWRAGLSVSSLEAGALGGAGDRRTTSPGQQYGTVLAPTNERTVFVRHLSLLASPQGRRLNVPVRGTVDGRREWVPTGMSVCLRISSLRGSRTAFDAAARALSVATKAFSHHLGKSATIPPGPGLRDTSGKEEPGHTQPRVNGTVGYTAGLFTASRYHGLLGFCSTCNNTVSLVVDSVAVSWHGSVLHESRSCVVRLPYLEVTTMATQQQPLQPGAGEILTRVARSGFSFGADATTWLASILLRLHKLSILVPSEDCSSVRRPGLLIHDVGIRSNVLGLVDGDYEPRVSLVSPWRGVNDQPTVTLAIDGMETRPTPELLQLIGMCVHDYILRFHALPGPGGSAGNVQDSHTPSVPRGTVRDWLYRRSIVLHPPQLMMLGQARPFVPSGFGSASLGQVIEVPPVFSQRRSGVIANRMLSLRDWSVHSQIAASGRALAGSGIHTHPELLPVVRFQVRNCRVSAASALSKKVGRPKYVAMVERAPAFDELQVWREQVRAAAQGVRLFADRAAVARAHHRAFVPKVTLDLAFNRSIAHFTEGSTSKVTSGNATEWLRAPEPSFALSIQHAAVRACSTSSASMVRQSLVKHQNGSRRGDPLRPTASPGDAPLSSRLPYISVKRVDVSEENAVPISTRRAQHGGQGSQRLVMVSTEDATCTCTPVEMVDALLLAFRQATCSQDLASAVRLAYTMLPGHKSNSHLCRIEEAGWRVVDAADACRHSIGPNDHDRAVVLQVRNTQFAVRESIRRSGRRRFGSGGTGTNATQPHAAIFVRIRDVFSHCLPAMTTVTGVYAGIAATACSLKISVPRVSVSGFVAPSRKQKAQGLGTMIHSLRSEVGGILDAVPSVAGRRWDVLRKGGLSSPSVMAVAVTSPRVTVELDGPQTVQRASIRSIANLIVGAGKPFFEVFAGGRGASARSTLGQPLGERLGPTLGESISSIGYLGDLHGTEDGTKSALFAVQPASAIKGGGSPAMSWKAGRVFDELQLQCSVTDTVIRLCTGALESKLEVAGAAAQQAQRRTVAVVQLVKSVQTSTRASAQSRRGDMQSAVDAHLNAQEWLPTAKAEEAASEVSSAFFIEELREACGKDGQAHNRPAMELRLERIAVQLSANQRSGIPCSDPTEAQRQLHVAVERLSLRKRSFIEPLLSVDNVRLSARQLPGSVLSTICVTRPELRGSAALVAGIASLVVRLRRTFGAMVQRLTRKLPGSDPRKLLQAMPQLECRAVVRWFTFTWRTAQHTKASIRQQSRIRSIGVKDCVSSRTELVDLGTRSQPAWPSTREGLQLDLRRIAAYIRVSKGDDQASGSAEDRLNVLGHVVLADMLVSAMSRAQSRVVIASIPRLGLDVSALARVSHSGSLGWFIDSGIVISEKEGYSTWSTRAQRVQTLGAVARIETRSAQLEQAAAVRSNIPTDVEGLVPPSPWSQGSSELHGPLVTLSADYVGIAWRLTRSVLQVLRPFGLEKITDHKYRPGKKKRARVSLRQSKEPGARRRSDIRSFQPFRLPPPPPLRPARHVLLGLRLSGAEISQFEVRLWRSLIAPTIDRNEGESSSESEVETKPDAPGIGRDMQSTRTADETGYTPVTPTPGHATDLAPPIGLRVIIRQARASLTVSAVQLKHGNLAHLVDHGLLLLTDVDPFADALGTGWVVHDAAFSSKDVEVRLVAVPWAPRPGHTISDERQRVRAAMWDGSPAVRLTGTHLSTRACKSSASATTIAHSFYNGSNRRPMRAQSSFDGRRGSVAGPLTASGSVSADPNPDDDSGDSALINLSVDSLRVLLRAEDRDGLFSLIETYVRRVVAVMSHLSEPPWQLVGQVEAMTLQQASSRHGRGSNRGSRSRGRGNLRGTPVPETALSLPVPKQGWRPVLRARVRNGQVGMVGERQLAYALLSFDELHSGLSATPGAELEHASIALEGLAMHCAPASLYPDLPIVGLWLDAQVDAPGTTAQERPKGGSSESDSSSQRSSRGPHLRGDLPLLLPVLQPTNAQLKITAARLGKEVGATARLSPLPPARSLYDVASTFVDIRLSHLNVTLDSDRLKCLVLVGKAAAKLPQQFVDHGQAAGMEHLMSSIADDFDSRSSSVEMRRAAAKELANLLYEFRHELRHTRGGFHHLLKELLPLRLLYKRVQQHRWEAVHAANVAMALAEEQGILDARRLLHQAHTPHVSVARWPHMQWLNVATRLAAATVALMDRKARAALSLQDSRRHQLGRQLQKVLESARFLPNAKISIRLQEVRVDLADRADGGFVGADEPRKELVAGPRAPGLSPKFRSRGAAGSDKVFFQLRVDRILANIDSHESGKLIVGVDVGELKGNDRRPLAAFPVPVCLLPGHPRVLTAAQEATQNMQSLQRREDEEIRADLQFTPSWLTSSGPGSTGRAHLGEAVRRVALLQKLVGGNASDSIGIPVAAAPETSTGPARRETSSPTLGQAPGMASKKRRGRAASQVLLGGLLGNGGPSGAIDPPATEQVDLQEVTSPQIPLGQTKWWRMSRSAAGMNAESVVSRLGEIHRSILRWDARLAIRQRGNQSMASHHDTGVEAPATPVALPESATIAAPGRRSTGIRETERVPQPQVITTGLLTSWSAFRAQASARGLVRELSKPGEANATAEGLLAGPVAPGADTLTKFSPRFYWSEVPDRWQADKDEGAAEREAAKGPGPVWIHFALEMKIPASGITNVSHATVRALPLKLGLSGSLVARIVSMVQEAIRDASEELSFPADFWTARPIPIEEIADLLQCDVGAGRPSTGATPGQTKVAHLAGFVGASPYLRSSSGAGRSRAQEHLQPSVTARASVARQLLESAMHARADQEGQEQMAGPRRRALLLLHHEDRGVPGGGAPEAAALGSLGMESGIRAAVRTNIQAQQMFRRKRPGVRDPSSTASAANWRLVLAQNQCEFVLGDPVAWQRGSGSEGTTEEEALGHHVPLPSGAVFGVVLPSGLAMQVAISPEDGSDEAMPEGGALSRSRADRKQLDVVGFDALCLSAHSDYARFARLGPDAAFSLAEGMRQATSRTAGLHRLALAQLVEGHRRLRLPLPANVRKIWGAIARHAQAAPCPAVHEEIRRSVRAFAADCVREALLGSWWEQDEHEDSRGADGRSPQDATSGLAGGQGGRTAGISALGRVASAGSGSHPPSRAGAGSPDRKDSGGAGAGSGRVASDRGQSHHQSRQAADEMAERARGVMVFRFIRLESVEVEFHFVSEDEEGRRPLFSLADVSGLRIKLHPVVVQSETCSAEDLLMDLRNTVIMDILSQAGQNFQNIGAYLAPRLGLGGGSDDGFSGVPAP